MEKNTLSVEKIGDITIIHVLERRIFLQVTDRFREELLSEVDKGLKYLVIDLSKVSVMNSAGLGVLLQVRDKFVKSFGHLILAGLQPIIQDIFTRMKLDSFFEICTDYNEAMGKLVEEGGIKKAYKKV